MVATVVMASPVVSAAWLVWAGALLVVAAGLSGFIAWALETKKRVMVWALIAAAVLTAILITGTQARADDFACGQCCVWWFLC